MYSTVQYSTVQYCTTDLRLSDIVWRTADLQLVEVGVKATSHDSPGGLVSVEGPGTSGDDNTGGLQLELTVKLGTVSVSKLRSRLNSYN